MSSFFSELGGLTGGVGSEALAFAAGFAAARALEPAAVTIGQDAWSVAPVRRLPAGAAAEAAAQGLLSQGAGADEALHGGFDSSRFGAMYGVALTAPGTGELLTLLRRGLINDGNFTHGLRKAKREPMWDDALRALKQDILAPADLARAIHRGLIPDPGLLEGHLPTAEGNVPAYPVYPIDALQEALGNGFDRDRLGVLVGLQGNPMGPHEAAEAMFRGVLDYNDYLRAIAEGNTRNEWADAILQQSRQIPTARDFVENALRGYRDLNSALEGAALHGMSAEHATMIYQNQGRPMAVSLITKALARGGVFKPEPGELTDPYEASIVEGNIKPAYYDLAKQLRYSYPSAFLMRALVQEGGLSEQDFAQYGREQGWKPELADQIAKAVAGGSTANVDPNVKKAETQLWTATHKGFLSQANTDAAIKERLAMLDVTGDAQTRVLALWEAERSLIHAQLTPKQVKDAIGQPGKDKAWAHEQLVERGYSADDADTYLAE